MSVSGQAPAAPLDDPGRIVAMASAYYASATLFAALDCGVFAQLALTPGATLEALAGALRADGRGLRLLLDGCVAVGLLVKTEGRYRNAPAAALTLVPGAAHDLTQAIRYNQDVYGAWGRLAELVKSGRPVEAPAVHLGADADRTRRFVLAMHGRALGIGRAVVPMLYLAAVRRLLDVGGGSGAYSMMLAQAHPALRCTLIDLPAIAAVTDELIDAADLGERVRTVPGDYHTTPFPSGMDVVVFFGVLHQEAPESICALLKRAHDALNPGGRVFVLDMMTDAIHTQPPFSALFAINMASTSDHGWVFSDRELSDWLAEAGFTGVDGRAVPPPMPHVLITARKPETACG